MIKQYPGVGKKPKGRLYIGGNPSGFKSAYFLRSQEKDVEILRFEGNHFMRRGIAKTIGGDLLFKFSRFSLPKVTISTQDSIVAEVILETNWGWYGNLDLPGGYHYKWKPVESSKNFYSFSDTNDNAVVIIRPRLGFFKFETEVEIDPAGLHNPHLFLLTMLGWFLVLLRMS